MVWLEIGAAIQYSTAGRAGGFVGYGESAY